jgi:hypothetical protein
VAGSAAGRTAIEHGPAAVIYSFLAINFFICEQFWTVLPLGPDIVPREGKGFALRAELGSRGREPFRPHDCMESEDE